MPLRNRIFGWCI